jgi:uncharacterized membrane protein YsdA (DUF1294 family)
MFFQWLLAYFITINIISFTSMGMDKWKAIKGKWRTKESTLWLYAFVGGALGSTIGMHVFRHKISQPRFKIGFPLLLLIQAVIIFYLLNLS